MVKISSNIIDSLNKNDRFSVSEYLKSLGLGETEYYKYIEKEAVSGKQIKYILQGLPLANLINDSEGLNWQAISGGVKRLIEITSNKENIDSKYQFWIQDTSKPTAMSAAFSVNKDDDVDLILQKLKSKITSSLGTKEILNEKNKIILFGYDKDENSWNIQQL